MRGYGCAVGQIAADMARRFGLRPRVAWRHALGWTQWQVSQQYNTLHPGAKLSDHRVSEYEVWPHGGAPPSLRYLARLAATFGHGCTPAQLVDADDLEQLSPADRSLLTTGHPATASNTGALGLVPPTTPTRRSTQVTVLPAGEPESKLVVPAAPALWATALSLQLPDDLAPLLMTCLGSLTGSDGDALATPGERDQAYHRLVQFLTSWAHTMNRRNALRNLGWAATTASLIPTIDRDGPQRVVAVLGQPGNRVDAQIINYIDTVLWHCTRQDDAFGPHAVLDTVLAQRQLARTLLPKCPESLRPQLLSTLSSATRVAGWLSFNLNDFTGAAYYYEDARALAHEAENIGLGAHVLRHMSHLAVWQGQPRIGIDHAVAADAWANRAGDMRLRAYCADGTAVAYAADGQRHACLTALDAAHTALGKIGDQPPGSLYSYEEGAHIMHRGLCHLKLGDAPRAADYAQQSLRTLDPSYTRDVAMTTVDLSCAYVQSKEIDEAARLLGDAGEIAADNSSARLIAMMKQARADLHPWENTAAVRALDDRLTSHGVLLT